MPAYGQPGYPTYPQPGYPPAGYPQPGYPPTAYQAGAYQPVPAPRRPGLVRAAAVLAFIQGAFNLASGIPSASGSGGGPLDQALRSVSGPVLAALAIASVLSAGLLIAGGVSALNRSATLINIGAALSILVGIATGAVTGFDPEAMGAGFVLIVMPILILSFVNAAGPRAWFTSSATSP